MSGSCPQSPHSHPPSYPWEDSITWGKEMQAAAQVHLGMLTRTAGIFPFTSPGVYRKDWLRTPEQQFPGPTQEPAARRQDPTGSPGDNCATAWNHSSHLQYVIHSHINCRKEGQWREKGGTQEEMTVVAWHQGKAKPINQKNPQELSSSPRTGLSLPRTSTPKCS